MQINLEPWEIENLRMLHRRLTQAIFKGDMPQYLNPANNIVLKRLLNEYDERTPVAC